ncbi:MAG TPA: hypothetical protein VF380_10130 [Solirubrobacteraceae bacterium]
MTTLARTRVRALLGSALIATCLLLSALAPAAHAAFGVTESKFEAGTCNVASCTYASPLGDFYTQAAGHPPAGITGFELNHKGSEPEGAPLKRIRVDVPPGLAANPEALEKCPVAEFEAGKCGTSHPGSRVGTNKLVAFVPSLGIDTPETEAPVYNLEQPAGLPLVFGIEVALLHQYILLKGHVAFNSDYHEYFEIDVPKEGELTLGIKIPVSVLKSKLIFEGRAGKGDFLTLSTICSATTTSHLEVESYSGETSTTPTTPPAGVDGCDKVPFSPTSEVKPETTMSDQPDGGTTEIKVPQQEGASEINTADIKDVHLALPEGLTLNPSAAHGLAACSDSQFAAGSCPAASKVGGVTIETDLPPGSLSGGVTPGSPGGVFLGSPSGATITDPPFNVYIDAESVYGVSVRLKGLATPDPTTGRLQVSFANNPQLPFSDLILKLNGGPRAPLANPLTCGISHVEALFTPYTGLAPALASSPFATDANGHGGACASPLPFTLAQSTHSTSAKAGAYTAYTFNLARGDGQQYLSQLSTVLPAGLLGAIPSLTPCAEPQAAAGTCVASSLIGTAAVSVGAGGEPYGFSGPVYLTGPYGGAPYGLSIPIEAAAGPFDLGRIVTRAKIGVDTYSGRVIVTAAIPRIVKGVPLRLRGLSVAVNRGNFLFNPTSCSPLATESTLTSTFGATQRIPSPFQVGGCSALKFKPSFSATTNSRTKKVTGASLQVSMTQGAHQANIRSVVVQLPKPLPSRLSTLQKSCLEGTFAASPRSCPEGSLVGVATVSTPVLPQKLTGPAYLVSHGGAAFPDLDLVLEGDHGVRVILVGNTNISRGVTTSTFASIPDVPVSSFSLSLPMGPHSALSAYGNLCAAPLVMPTTITAQNGAQFKQGTRLSVSNCGVRILRHRISGHTLILTVRSFAAGRIGVSGRNLRTVYRRVSRPATVTFRVPLARSGLATLGSGRRLHVRVRVGFVPRARGESRSVALASVFFRH